MMYSLHGTDHKQQARLHFMDKHTDKQPGRHTDWPFIPGAFKNGHKAIKMFDKKKSAAVLMGYDRSKKAFKLTN